MDQAWLQQRPHLKPLMHSINAMLQLADAQYQEGRASGEAIDYSEFEERVAHANSES